MKTSIVGLCILGFAALSGTAQAQCGCCSSNHTSTLPYRAVGARTYSTPINHSAPMTHSDPMAAGSISYVNKLDAPVNRGTFSLLYAVHLSNGRLLYTDSVPAGFDIRGTEPYGSGRKANVNVGSDGRLNINDPATNQVIAVIQQ